jgi:hypothetical protein
MFPLPIVILAYEEEMDFPEYDEWLEDNVFIFDPFPLEMSPELLAQARQRARDNNALLMAARSPALVRFNRAQFMRSFDAPVAIQTSPVTYALPVWGYSAHPPKLIDGLVYADEGPAEEPFQVPPPFDVAPFEYQLEGRRYRLTHQFAFEAYLRRVIPQQIQQPDFAPGLEVRQRMAECLQCRAEAWQMIVQTNPAAAAAEAAAMGEQEEVQDQEGKERKDTTNMTRVPFLQHWDHRMTSPNVPVITLEERDDEDMWLDPFMAGMLRYLSPKASTERLPPILTTPALNDPETADTLRNLDISDKGTNLVWLNTIVSLAEKKQLDPACMIVSILPYADARWVLSLLCTQTFHFWSAAGFQALRSAVETRLNNSRMGREAEAMEEWIAGFKFNTDYENLFLYAGRIEDCAIRTGTLIEESMKCRVFLKGLPRPLRFACRRTPRGRKWKNFQALQCFTEERIDECLNI